MVDCIGWNMKSMLVQTSLADVFDVIIFNS